MTEQQFSMLSMMIDNIPAEYATTWTNKNVWKKKLTHPHDHEQDVTGRA